MRDEDKRYVMMKSGEKRFLKDLKEGDSFKLFEADGEEIIIEGFMKDGFFLAAYDAFPATLEDLEEDRWTVEVESFKTREIQEK